MTTEHLKEDEENKARDQKIAHLSKLLIEISKAQAS
jgi:hypothetical protein